MPGTAPSLLLWAYQAHLPFEHVYELGQLIYAPAPQKTSDPGHARVVAHLEDRPLCLVQGFQFPLPPLRLLLHGAEHVAEENLLVSPDPFLAEEHRPRRVEPDGDRDDQKERGE
jgi:hypothetical protein